ncbi:MAG: tRNA preQ1(34) S-adenosylmethionine ribosyltransferase-isomerase QueA [Pedosphaera sp.]|nr:tRNA preQ1(34) S-adenosylmethionine ribosyltransferase-isomerase QueA [Pedosphaera sp.]
MRTEDFDYSLPQELIAQKPRENREDSRLLVYERPSTLTHKLFPALIHSLTPKDVLVLNDTRVIAARARGVKLNGGGLVEILLVEEIARNDWWVMLRPGKRVRPGTIIRFWNRSGQPSEIEGVVEAKNDEGLCRISFCGTPDVTSDLDQIGEIPLPPYIHRNTAEHDTMDNLRYQTVFANKPGSVAAPTAGLHFTKSLLDQIEAMGVTICTVTLHIGLGTFAPVKADDIANHVMHEERFELSSQTASAINSTQQRGGRVFAVGTTTLRVLESVAAEQNGQIAAARGRTKIFIHPPFQFRVVDALVTNFHLPCSTLLMLVSAFASPGQTSGRAAVLSAYKAAITEKYRFFSYGDAMLIL